MPEAQGINSVEIAISILDALAKTKEPTRAIDLAQTLGLSKSRLHKYLVSLCRKNILYQNPYTNRYSFGKKLAYLGSAVTNNYGIYHMINSHLALLKDKTNMPTGLIVKKMNELHLIHYNHHNKREHIHLNGHKVVSSTESAAGKIFLAYTQYLNNNQNLNIHEYDFIKNKGYYIMDNDSSMMTSAKVIATPILDLYNNLIAIAIIADPYPANSYQEGNLINQLLHSIEEIRKNL